MNRKVLLLSAVDQAGVEVLKEGRCEVIQSRAETEEERAEEMRRYDPAAIITRTDLAVSARLMAAAPSLQVISRHGVGVDNIDIPEATKRGIRVTHVVDGNYLSVAEHAMFLMLASARQYGKIRDALLRDDYAVRSGLLGMELRGKTVGLIGTGHIGKALASMAAAFGMTVTGYSRHAPAGTVSEEGIHFLKSRDDVLEGADFAVLCLPATKETIHSIGAREFQIMKKSAFLINVARGSIVVEKELIEALQSHVIAGAGLDVFDPEPPVGVNPLFHMDNVIATPHSAALTKEALRKLAVRAAEQVVQVLDGKEPEFPVN